MGRTGEIRYESHGMRGVARESYAELALEERDWKNADLDAGTKKHRERRANHGR